MSHKSKLKAAVLELIYAIFNLPDNVPGNADDFAAAIVAVCAVNGVELVSPEDYIKYGCDVPKNEAEENMQKHNGDVLAYFTDRISVEMSRGDFDTLCEAVFNFDTIR